MKNLVVHPSPGSVTTEGVRLPARVFLNYYSEQSGDGEELVYATHSYLLAPAQARALAIELAVAAERADGNSEAGTSLLAAMLRDVLPKKTAATGEPASPGDGLAGDGTAGDAPRRSEERATNVAPAGPARGGERPENRGGTQWPECTTCQRRKAPFGRDVAAAMHGDLCDRDCDGYYQAPDAPADWPGSTP